MLFEVEFVVFKGSREKQHLIQLSLVSSYDNITNQLKSGGPRYPVPSPPPPPQYP